MSEILEHMLDGEFVCQKGIFKLEEWEDINYCEHCFWKGEDPLTDREVIALLADLTTENEQLRKDHKRQENEIKLLREVYSKIPPKIREVWKE